MLSTSDVPVYLFWHNVSHQASKDFWNNSYLSLLKALWITDFPFISLIYFTWFFESLICPPSFSFNWSHQHFTINDIASTGLSVLSNFKSIYETWSILWYVVYDFVAVRYTVKINNTNMNSQTCNLGFHVSLFPVEILIAESSIFSETPLAQKNYLGGQSPGKIR